MVLTLTLSVLDNQFKTWNSDLLTSPALGQIEFTNGDFVNKMTHDIDPSFVAIGPCTEKKLKKCVPIVDILTHRQTDRQTDTNTQHDAISLFAIAND